MHSSLCVEHDHHNDHDGEDGDDNAEDGDDVDLVKTGTVTAWRIEECGAPSWTPIRPQPTTVARVPGPSLMIIYHLVFDVVNEDDNVLRLIRHKPTRQCCVGPRPQFDDDYYCAG